MCGIFGYVGNRTDADSILLHGLETLEYRGYDSAGIAVHDGKSIDLFRSVGKVSELVSTVENSRNPAKKYCMGIGHTRWATHGGVTIPNTHPHHDTKREFYIVHNGIVENFRELRAELEAKGVKFYGETDSEVVAKMIEHTSWDNLLERVEKVLPKLEWAYALLVISTKDPSEMIGVKYGSPLIFGKGAHDTFFFSSDANGLADHTKSVVFLEDGDLAYVKDGKYSVRREGCLVSRAIERIDVSKLHVDKGSYKHFMLKEIFETPESITEVFRGRVNFEDLSLVSNAFQNLRDTEFENVEFIACGTSYHAGLLGTYWIEEIAGMNAKATIASEFFSKPVRVRKDTLYVFISQSGETADSLEPLKYLKENGAKTFGIVNVVGSSIARMTDMGLFTHSGTEVGVASTKVFIGQIGAVLLLSLFFSIQRGGDYRVYRSILGCLDELPLQAHEVLDLSGKIRKIAGDFSKYEHCFFLSRASGVAVAMEAALKFKEITYRHAQALALGELKHGSLALIDEGCPSVVFVPNDECFLKNCSSIDEIKARWGKVFAISERPVEHADWNIVVPSCSTYTFPFLASIVGQLFAYHTADILGRDIDKPRNLAKSVTVK